MDREVSPASAFNSSYNSTGITIDIVFFGPRIIINHPSVIITCFRLNVNTLFQIKIYTEGGDLLCIQESVICVRMLICRR